MNADTTHFVASDLLHRLMTEFGMSAEAAEGVATKLARVGPRVRGAFWRWWTTGIVDESLPIEGYTVGRLLADGKAPTPVAAFVALDYLARDPRGATRVLGWRERKPRFRSVAGS